MKIKRLGRTGLKVSEICLGTMTFGNQCDQPTSHAIMSKAFDAGVTFFDTADAYPLGATSETVGRTEEYIGIDLYQMHFPDHETPIDETLRALDDLVHSGKVLYIGCSNFPAWELCQALWTSDKLWLARFDCVQPRYNLLFRQIEAELLPLAMDQGIGVISYNPLAGGLLTGRYQPGQAPQEGSRFTVQNAGKLYQERYWQDPQMQAVEELKAFCQQHHINIAQLAIAWVLSQPAITSAIVGASKPEHLDQSLPAVDLVLDEQMRAVCDDIWYRLPRERNRDIAFR
ncbi:MAG: aldo/keto reductase [Chloroflexi bacterium]|nr:MAG: aldo/keto reductase [Chloroflexota bacterium]